MPIYFLANTVSSFQKPAELSQARQEAVCPLTPSDAHRYRTRTWSAALDYARGGEKLVSAALE